MSAGERDRLAVIRRVAAGELRQARAAELLGLGIRQVKRLAAAYRLSGDAGLVSGRRGRPSNNQLASGVLPQIEAALQSRYGDFGATFAAEKLRLHEGIRVSAETVRQVQIRLGLWRPKRRREKRVHQTRDRRPRFGELIQIDGSRHAWFEDRAPMCTLLVFIDDATGRLTGLQFAGTETAHGYLELLRRHVLAHGLPLALYSDKHGIFRVNAKEAVSGDGLTEFGRVMGRLGIEQICANTPQAKGRVERANQTLQDRLIKEMRLAGISDMAAAQAYLPGFIERHNAQFSVAARVAEDAHRAWDRGAVALDEALARHDVRTLSKALTFSAGGARHCIKTRSAGIAFRGAKITVRHYQDGRMDVIFKGRVLPHTTFKQLAGAAAIETDKTVDARVDALIAKLRQPEPSLISARGCGRPGL